ncbi:hypothetical protein Aph01nite_12910 [Acrocarpospora phusangensis]|uniref:Uncharacterized protein n=1 Tax=Acrocarpospora phusangensis TaxID=1070424 RepID=A0A919UIR4_9ACTN|nr:hypothetical protein [Acrocarpospora phusangensis]GIH22981.1 hypothetical protein Aph01nite_12910 [Acrocarpospora phusangensis]
MKEVPDARDQAPENNRSGECPAWCGVPAPHPDLSHLRSIGLVTAHRIELTLIGDQETDYVLVDAKGFPLIGHIFELSEARAEVLGILLSHLGFADLRILGAALTCGYRLISEGSV